MPIGTADILIAMAQAADAAGSVCCSYRDLAVMTGLPTWQIRPAVKALVLNQEIRTEPVLPLPRIRERTAFCYQLL